MQIPKMPADEDVRLAALESLELLDTAKEERFDRITRLARRQFRSKMALISLVDRKRQWFKSSQGLAAPETSRDISFCGHAILEPERPFIVRDATEDPRFHDNPLVTGDPNIRFYVGQPIRSPEGQPVGTLCVLDTSPRDITPDELETLADLARIVEDELRAERLTLTEQALRAELASAERRAMVDALTRVWSRATIFQRLKGERDRAIRGSSTLAALMIDIDHFKNINDQYGHPAGDAVLREVAARLTQAVRSMDTVGRYGGEEFLAVLPECNRDNALTVAERMRLAVRRTPIAITGGTLTVTVSVGVALESPRQDQGDQEALIARADGALYSAKRGGRDRVAAA